MWRQAVVNQVRKPFAFGALFSFVRSVFAARLRRAGAPAVIEEIEHARGLMVR
jgi:hypothetical protein